MKDVLVVVLALIVGAALTLLSVFVYALRNGMMAPALDGARHAAPASSRAPADDLPPLPTAGMTEEVVRGAPMFTPETIQRVTEGLRDQYIVKGVPIPSEAELRVQAMRALQGYDI